jgi:hypothetical protein
MQSGSKFSEGALLWRRILNLSSFAVSSKAPNDFVPIPYRPDVLLACQQGLIFRVSWATTQDDRLNLKNLEATTVLSVWV